MCKQEYTCAFCYQRRSVNSLQWRNNERDDVSNHQAPSCLLNRLFRRRSKKTSKLCVTGLCEGNSPMTVEFPTQRASNAENVSIWCHHISVEINACRSSCIRKKIMINAGPNFNVRRQENTLDSLQATANDKLIQQWYNVTVYDRCNIINERLYLNILSI